MFIINKWSITLLILFMKIVPIFGFNLSPVPNLIIKEPNFNQRKSNESSHFGYTLNFRGQNIMIGAPRANSILHPARQFDQPGVIYKCSLTSRNCRPFLLDVDDDNQNSQGMGTSMHGGSKETDSFIVCAPRRKLPYADEERMNGVCYWMPNTKHNSTIITKKIAALKNYMLQVVEYIPYYMLGEQGFSTHISEYNNDILMGAPGVSGWRGALVYLREVRPTGNENIYIFPGDTFSYFGYSVTAGIFEGKRSNKVFYVVSAPKSNNQQGEVYIIYIMLYRVLSNIAPLHGNQYGEYFGYVVLAEDFNGDDYTDLAISAPLYKTGLNFDNGAVYIFMNKRNLNFELDKTLTSGSSLPSRFGTTITKLGDIDHDGFNDIAIGAPFTEDAGVYIYLGGPKGLSDKPSQILKNPDKHSTGYDMFGHGLSQGADIDGNFYNDLAVGAPNRDKVYLYKSYPVVEIIASINTTTRQINSESGTFNINACWKLHYNVESENPKDQNIKIIIKLDPTYKRVTFEDNKYNKTLDDLVTEKDKCIQYTIKVKKLVQANSNPILIEMYYKLESKISEDGKFQENVVLTNPSHLNVTQTEIIVTKSCKNDICSADLIITSTVANTFVIGSSNTLAINYMIRNIGEDTAYLPKLMFKTTIEIPFAKLPALCMMNQNELNCDLTDDYKLSPSEEKNWTILLDMTKYSGKGFNISAAVSSAGDENNSLDNEVRNSVKVDESSEISYSQNSIQLLVYPKTLKTAKVVNKLEIRNQGPSNIKKMTVKLSIPTSYLDPIIRNSTQFLDFDHLKIVAKHNKRNLNIKFSQNNETLQRKFQKEASENINSVTLSEDKNPGSRKKRDAENEQNNQLDPLAVQGEIPFNKAIILNCSDIVESNCILSEFIVNNLQPGNNVIEIMLQYELNLEKIYTILGLENEFFVLSTMLGISKAGDDEHKSPLQPTGTISHIVISREPDPVGTWIYIISIMAGLLALVLITYGMYKAGFFRRKKKEELKKLIRESQRVVPRKYENEQNVDGLESDTI